MSSRPKTLDADQTVAAAAQLMRGADIGDVIVVKSDDRLHGILTDRDIVVPIVGRHRCQDATANIADASLIRVEPFGQDADDDVAIG
jgi:CBS domain-containing protein